MTLHEVSLSYDYNALAEELRALLHQNVNPEWFEKWSAIADRVNDLYVLSDWCFSINTADVAADEQYKSFLEHGLPKIDKVWNELSVKASAFQPSEKRFQRIVSRFAMESVTSSPTAIETEKRENSLIKQYSTLVSQRVLDTGETVVQARGRLKTLRDESARKTLWQQIEKKVLEDAPVVEQIYLDLITLRTEKAKELGFENFVDYSWASKRRVSYTPNDSLRLIHSASQIFADVMRGLKTYKARVLKTNELRPWHLDIAFDLTATRQLSEAEYLKITKRVFRELSANFGDIVDNMIEKGHLDIMNRPNKETMNFTTRRTLTNEPLVLVNCTGNPDNLRAVFHELGHGLHHAHIGPGKLYFEKGGPKEVNEFFAYTFQTLGAHKLIELDFFAESEKLSYHLSMLNNVLEYIEGITVLEQFEHWVYTQSNMSTTALNQKFLSLAQDGVVNWTSFETELSKNWQKGSVVSSPFYTIEYVIAWIAALIFVKRLHETPAIMAKFEEAITFGNTRNTAETFRTLGIRFPFSEHEIREARTALDILFPLPI